MQPHVITPEMQTARYSVKWTCFFVPFVPGLYKIQWIVQMLTCLSCKVVRTTGQFQQLNIIIALVHIVLASC